MNEKLIYDMYVAIRGLRVSKTRAIDTVTEMVRKHGKRNATRGYVKEVLLRVHKLKAA